MSAAVVFKPLRRRRLWLAWWCVAIVAVVVASLLPASDLPLLPPGSDKFEHFLAYGALAAAAVQLFTRPAAVRATLALIVLGVAVEFAQAAFTSSRMMDPVDALADALGALLGLATVLTPWRDMLLRFDRRS